MPRSLLKAMAAGEGQHPPHNRMEHDMFSITSYEVKYAMDNHHGQTVYLSEMFSDRDRAVAYAKEAKAAGCHCIHVYERIVTEIEF